MKICGRCKKNLLIESFGKDKRRKDGLMRMCKECVRIQYIKVQKPYRQKKREHIRFMEREREARNREKMNHFYFKKLTKFHWQKNKRKISVEEVQSMLIQQNKKCFYCKVELTGSNLHIEHYYPKSNDKIVLACADCNRLKWTKTGDEFFIFIKEYVSRFL